MSSSALESARRVSFSAGFFLPVIALIWVLAWQAYLQHVGQAASNQIATLANGDTPFQWDFRNPTQVINPQQNGLINPQFGEAGLHAIISPSGGNVSLRLNGRVLSSQLHHWLYLTIDVPKRTPLRLYWREHLDGPEYGNRGIKLVPGLNTVSLDLRQIDWQEVASGGQEQADPARVVVPWGGRSGAIRALRVHPGRGEDFPFHLISVSIGPDPAQAPPTVDLVILDQDIWTPEMGRWLSDQETAQAPEKIVLPGAIDPAKFPRMSEPDRLFPAATSAPRILTVLAALYLLGVLVRLWRPLPLPALAYLDLALIMLGAGWLLLGIGQGDALPLWSMLVIAGLGALVVLGNLRGFRISWAIMASTKAWLEMLLATLPLVVILIALSFLPDSGQRWSELWPGVLVYIPWALIQQFILGPVLCERLIVIFPATPRLAAGFAGMLFGLFHYPNFALMCVTFLMGSLWGMVYLRYRCLLPQAVMHASLGTLLFAVAPPWLLFNAAIGISYFY